jgi:hypothetical protein
MCNIGALTYDFDLTKHNNTNGGEKSITTTGAIDDLAPGTIITYHNINDAGTGDNVIATSHTISTAENGAVIYARIKNPTNACFETRSFAFALLIVNNGTILAT